MAHTQPFPGDSVAFGPVIEFKMSALRRAVAAFFADASRADRAAFDHFCKQTRPWLDDFALFMALKDAHNGTAWTSWDAPICQREAHAVSQWSQKLAPQIDACKFWQFEFFRSWEHLKAYCAQRGIRFMGDVPIYIAHDSADVWAHPELFYLNGEGKPTVVSGVSRDRLPQLVGSNVSQGSER